jgi:hypothetical protein
VSHVFPLLVPESLLVNGMHPNASLFFFTHGSSEISTQEQGIPEPLSKITGRDASNTSSTPNKESWDWCVSSTGAFLSILQGHLAGLTRGFLVFAFSIRGFLLAAILSRLMAGESLDGFDLI